MKGVLLAALLASSAAPAAGRTWTVDPGQALVTVDADAFSAFSHGLTGTLSQLDNGLMRLELRLPFASVTTGDPRQDRRAAREGDAVFEGVAEDGSRSWRFVGTLTFHGVSRPVQLELGSVRTGTMIYGHAVMTLRLRDYGFKLPQDETRIELDAGFRQRGAVASRE
jgi:polyisoprenoid-binding protein YceI